MTNRKSHTPFRLVPKSTTLDDLDGRYAFCCRKDVSFGVHHKKLNEDRAILSAAKSRPMILVSGVIKDVCEYSWRFPGEGASNDSGIVENGNFQRFRWLFFGYFRDEASVIIWRYAVCLHADRLALCCQQAM